MYTAKHPRTREASQAMLDKLNDHFREAPNIKITASSGLLFMDGQPGDPRSLHTNNLCKTLAERLISGFQMEKGIGSDDLLGLLEILLLKPARIEELGGADTIIASKNLGHVRLTQTKFQEIEGDEELVAAAPGEVTDEESERRRLYNLWYAKLQESIETAIKEAEGTSWRPFFKGALPPANLKETGRLALDLKWETSSPPAVHLEAVQLALENLPAAGQLSVATGRASLPDIPPSLKKVMDGFFPDIVAKASVKLDNEGAEWNGLKEAIYLAITVEGDVPTLYKAFGTLWMKAGKDTAYVSEIKERIQWDYRSLRDQLAFIEQPGVLWTLAESQRVRLIAQIIEKLPPAAFRRLLEKNFAVSKSEDAANRESAARALESAAISIRALPAAKESEDILVDAMLAIFQTEDEPNVLAIALRGLQQMIGLNAARNEHKSAAALLSAIQSRVSQGQPNSSAQTRLLADLKSNLSTKENIGPVMQQYFQNGANYYNDVALPWLKALGPSAVECLMEMLAEESDRRRRGQSMDASRSYGSEILPKLVSSLQSDKWYLVRNTLILIAEMADSSCFSGVVACLGHPDARVKRAAARALWRGFGKLAAEPFLKVIKEVEPEIFEEILFGLAQIPAPAAIPIALDYAVDASNPDRLRAMALNVLVTNPSPDSLPVLAEIAKRKGRMITTAEPIAIRSAAAKAMMAAGGEGKGLLGEIVKSEPRGLDRDELAKILEP
jgi:hypothetical protein